MFTADLRDLWQAAFMHLSVSHCLSLTPICHACLGQVGPHICVLKTHVDIFDTWSVEIQHKLQQLAEKHGVQVLTPSDSLLC